MKSRTPEQDASAKAEARFQLSHEGLSPDDKRLAKAELWRDKLNPKTDCLSCGAKLVVKPVSGGVVMRCPSCRGPKGASRV